MGDRVFNFVLRWARKYPGGVFLLRFIYGFDLPKKAVIGKNIRFNHRGLGTVISANARIEDNIWIEHHVTLGMKMNGKEAGAPTVKSGVFLGAYSIILGNVTIGENSIIGAGTIVLNDVPADSKIINDIKTRFI